MKPSRKDRKSGRRRNPAKKTLADYVPSRKDTDSLIQMVGESAGALAISQACDGMTFEHKMVVSALIGSYIRPLLGYPKNKTIIMADENTEDTVSPG
jgi:uncharacterized protein (UPF0261 family)